MAVTLQKALENLSRNFQLVKQPVSKTSIDLWKLLKESFVEKIEKQLLSDFKDKSGTDKAFSALHEAILHKKSTDPFFKAKLFQVLSTVTLETKSGVLHQLQRKTRSDKKKAATKKGSGSASDISAAPPYKPSGNKDSTPDFFQNPANNANKSTLPTSGRNRGDSSGYGRFTRGSSGKGFGGGGYFYTTGGGGNNEDVNQGIEPNILRKIWPKVEPVSKKCYSLAEMDKQILMGKPAEVKLIISLEKLVKTAGKAGATGSWTALLAKKLIVRIRSVLNIKIKGPKEVKLEMPEKNNPVEAKLFVSPTREGTCKLAVDIWQGQVPVCTLNLVIEGVKVKTNTRKIRSSVESEPVTPFPNQVNQLRITERQEGKNCYYDYELIIPSKEVFKNFISPAIKTDRAKYVTNLYEEIENGWTTAAGNALQFQNEMRNFGAGLFNDLFPAELQIILYDNMENIKSIQVISTEPFIPWELMLIKKPGTQNRWKPADKFLGELGLIRWLHGWWPTPELNIRPGKARYVIPKYLTEDFQLPAAHIEEAYLIKEFKATPVKPDPETVNKLLRSSGSFDLLHFCCHGDANTGNITNSKLMLQEKQKAGHILPTYLTQTSVEQCGTIASKGNRPMIVLNACQAGRLGMGLTRYGGFANAFLQAGAGVFIGSLWSIEDNAAVYFITALYEALKNNKTLAEATIDAREIARKNKDATWISYVVYGNPFAKLKL